MPPIAAPADKRFRRAHVKPASRRGSARVAGLWTATRVVLSGGLAAYAAWSAVSLIAGATALQVGQITVRGHERLSTGEVLALVADRAQAFAVARQNEFSPVSVH